MRNIEVKVTISDKALITSCLKEMGAVYQYTMEQCDYYFGIGEDKEKLRVIDEREYQLITYRRQEKQGKKDSRYHIVELDAQDKDILLAQRKTVRRVEKTRELWLYRNTRIHIDYVKQLGSFLELETVIKDVSLKAGEDEFRLVADKLGISTTNSVAASYSDLVPVLA